MAYSNDPRRPRVRMKAVLLVRKGWSIRKVARHFGFAHSAVSAWVAKAPRDGRENIPTISSKPKTHPQALKRDTVTAIIDERVAHRRCAEVIHRELANKGVTVSLSSVKRTLKRAWLTKRRSPWKRYHPHVDRPDAAQPGDLVQIDTIHIVPRQGERFYIYTLIDLYSRWAYAKVIDHINTHESVRFVREAQAMASFRFSMLQSDHGSEFSTWFTEQIGVQSMSHRHSRVRQSNDNAHVERFNRTVQEECLDRVPKKPTSYRKAIQVYLPYYNNERLHLGINLLTPLQMVSRS